MMAQPLRKMVCSLAFPVATLALASAPLAALAASPPVAVQQKARAATFEVVVPKTLPDPLSYERPLPFDLEPYVIRTDAYWSIGSAFAIGKNEFATAGHVLATVVGSQFGTPALRDADGHIYPIDKVLKFSMDRDFAVFSVVSPPSPVPLTAKTTHKLDEIVYAVGNALGQGVVVRDGLLTSETPEDQDGRWKWLRFSAAASPGNSGGPLLDGSGAVIGVITAKSPNENLNYALPIRLLLDARTTAATFDLRQAFRLPVLRDAETFHIHEEFPLPKEFAEFTSAFGRLVDQTVSERTQESIRVNEAELFPKGNSAKLLATGYFDAFPTIVRQGDDKTWKAAQPEGVTSDDLPGDGRVTTGTIKDIQLFRLERPERDASDAIYSDPVKLANLLLKGLKISRTVGTESIRVTGLGTPVIDETHTDRTGRIWQIRAWWLSYSNSYVVLFCLPTPEGYGGFAQVVPSLLVKRAIAQGKVIADYVVESYMGTITQWQTFLARKPLLPAIFGAVAIDVAQPSGFRFESAQLTLDIPASAVHLAGRSGLELSTGYEEIDGKALWGVTGITLLEDIDRTTGLRISRWPRPKADTGQELQHRWEQMTQRRSPYDNVAQRLPPPGGYVIATSIGAAWNGGVGLDPGANALYEVQFGVESAALPRELEDRQHAIINGMHVLER